MKRAIIGHTGFVGGNLIKQTRFNDFYNSSNIKDIDGKSYDLVVCSGAPAAKWKANKEPEKDLENIKLLMSCIEKLKTKHIILISTVDVFPKPVKVDEDTPINENEGDAYGRNRFLLEKFINSSFHCTTIRLPGLFGKDLKKNVIYDFLNNNCTDMICPDSVFQFYFLGNLWEHIEIAIKHKIQLVNFATEPVSVGEIARKAFGFEFNNPLQTKPVFYDFRSKYDHVYGGTNGYLFSKKYMLTKLIDFVTYERDRSEQ